MYSVSILWSGFAHIKLSKFVSLQIISVNSHISKYLFNDAFEFYSKGKWYDEPKYIVSEGKLKELMSTCIVCGGKTRAERSRLEGAYAEFNITCLEITCGHERSWQTSETHRHTYVINLLLSACILFSGCLATKFLRALSFISVQIPTDRTFYRHQKEYLHRVNQLWKLFASLALLAT